MQGGSLGGRPSRWLRVALPVVTALVGAAATLRLLVPGPEAPPLPNRVFAVLVAAAFLCLAALLRSRLVAVPWLAAVLASAIAAIEVVAGLRSAGLVSDSGSDPVGLAIAVVGLVGAAGTAALYASVPRGDDDSPPWAAVLGFAAVASALAAAAVAAWALVAGTGVSSSSASGELAPVRLAGRAALIAVGLGLLAGMVRDLQPAFRRALARWHDSAGAAAGTAARPPSLLSLVADELVPGRGEDRRRAQEGERARLAADLHAFVLPDLRRAAAAVASPDTPDRVRSTVGRALEEVERLMQGRQSIVLEEFGLVAALEWLAERTEQAGGLKVELELEGSLVDAPDAVPPAIARAAFRIALLAVDNAARHGGANVATIRLSVDPGRITLEVRDDGARAATVSNGMGRGLADMRSEAASTGGALTTTPPPQVTVVATWPGQLPGRTA